jgi:hypothetical protein
VSAVVPESTADDPQPRKCAKTLTEVTGYSNRPAVTANRKQPAIPQLDGPSVPPPSPPANLCDGSLAVCTTTCASTTASTCTALCIAFYTPPSALPSTVLPYLLPHSLLTHHLLPQPSPQSATSPSGPLIICSPAICFITVCYPQSLRLHSHAHPHLSLLLS